MKDKLLGGLLFLLAALFGLAGVVKLVGHLIVMASAPLEGDAAASELGGALIGFGLVAVAYYAFANGKRRIWPPAASSGQRP